MECADLVARVTNYLERHIAWFEECLAALDRLAEDLADDRIEAVAAAQADRNARGEHLMREHRGLLAEWERCDEVPSEAQRAVRRLADRAEKCKEALSTRYEEAAGLLAQETTGREEAIKALRRGRQMVTRYRPADAPAANFIDRKA